MKETVRKWKVIGSMITGITAMIVIAVSPLAAKLMPQDFAGDFIVFLGWAVGILAFITLIAIHCVSEEVRGDEV